jgi:RimJ/RimL family protein N-acetyltransferase
MTALPAGPAYRVQSERLLARCWSPADAPLLRESLDASDAHLRPWIPFMKDEPRDLFGTVQRLREIRSRFDADEDYRYALFTPDGGTLVGETMLLGRAGAGALEIGYWIDVRHGGKGYATEAAGMMVRLGFELHRAERLEIHCSPGNGASAAVARKLGFTHDATLRRRFANAAGEIQDSMVWSLFADEVSGTKAQEIALEASDARAERLTLEA